MPGKRPTITEEPILITARDDDVPDTCRACGGTCTNAERRICLSSLEWGF